VSVSDEERALLTVSPGGKHSARVWSAVSDQQGVTYVLVELGWPARRASVGVFAVPQAEVPVRLTWRDDAHLVVAYPFELAPFRKAGCAQHGGDAVEIEYEPLEGWSRGDRPDDPPARRARSRTSTAPALYRGELVEVSAGRYRYEYRDADQSDSSRDELAARGLEGGGHSWAGIVHGLVVLRHPELRGRIELAPDGDRLVIHSRDREALVMVARLVTDAKRDADLLDLAIDTAIADGQMA